MSFIRRDARRFLLRWAEPAIYAGATALGAFWLHAQTGAWWLVAVALVAGGYLFYSALLAALAAQGDEEQGPGVVSVEERRLAYFGPRAGGVISIDEIFEIAISPPEARMWDYDTAWVLRWSKTEPALIIPAAAEGAEALLDAFAALPGFSPARALLALRVKDGPLVTIWRRDGGAAFTALARNGGGD